MFFALALGALIGADWGTAITATIDRHHDTLTHPVEGANIAGLTLVGAGIGRLNARRFTRSRRR